MKETNEITAENCRVLLAGYMETNEISAPKVSRALGCSHATTARILAGITLPTLEFMTQLGIMIELGYPRFCKLSKAERERISETLGATGGGVLGFGMISAAVGAAGIPGLSAAGITSGLVAIGAGGMLGGIITLAAIPIAVGAAGYGIIKGVKYIMSESELNSDDIDDRWEQRLA